MNDILQKAIQALGQRVSQTVGNFIPQAVNSFKQALPSGVPALQLQQRVPEAIRSINDQVDATNQMVQMRKATPELLQRAMPMIMGLSFGGDIPGESVNSKIAQLDETINSLNTRYMNASGNAKPALRQAILDAQDVSSKLSHPSAEDLMQQEAARTIANSRPQDPLAQSQHPSTGGEITGNLQELAQEAKKYPNAEAFRQGAKSSGITYAERVGLPENYADYFVKNSGGEIKQNAPKAVKDAFAKQSAIIDILADPKKAQDFYSKVTGSGGEIGGTRLSKLSPLGTQGKVIGKEEYASQLSGIKGNIVETNDPILKRFDFQSTHEKTETLRALETYNNYVRQGIPEPTILEKIKNSYGEVIKYNVEDITKAKKDYLSSSTNTGLMESQSQNPISTTKNQSYKPIIPQSSSGEIPKRVNEIKKIDLINKIIKGGK